MMENMKPVCWRCRVRVYIHSLSATIPLLSRRELNEHFLDNSPPYPVHFIEYTPCMYFTMYRTAMGGPANKGIYKYIRNRIYRINEKGG